MKGAMKYHARNNTHSNLWKYPTKKGLSPTTPPLPEEKIPVPQGRLPFLQELRDFKIPVIGFL
jgi:hypothetical protein